MATRARIKTVSFFEVVDENGDELEVIDWPEVLGDLAQETTADRGHAVGNVMHYGQAYPWNEIDHLVIARVREDVPTSLNVVTGDLIDEQTQTGRPWVEVSVVGFVPDTNKFGFVLGNQAAPRASSVAAWLNEHKIFEDPLDVQPVVSAELLRKLERERVQARLVKLELNSAQLQALDADAGLFSAAQQIGQDFGSGVSVEILIKIEGRTRSAPSETLDALGRAGRSLLGRNLEKALVELVEATADNERDTEMIDLIKQRLSSKQRVRVVDEEGEPIRIPSAITAIHRATDALGDLLR